MAVSKKINLSRLSYVTYSHPDLKKFLQFADDFGFQSAGQSDDGAVYLRGYGIDPYLYIAHQSQPGEPKTFHGAGFVAKTEADFNRACQMEGAQLVDISHRPGGGKMVRIMDPNGYPLEVVHGQTEREIVDKGITNVIGGQPNVNTAVTKPRQGEFNRMDRGPAMIHKLGHTAYTTDNHQKSCEWYSSNFNLKATDILHKPGDPSSHILAFYHLDLGREYSDHHCLLLAIQHGDEKGTVVHHSSFEVEDIDTQMLGHKWLLDKNYKTQWGVGRHVMGSQVFDYWVDTSGFVLEHYTDSDVVNEDNETCLQEGTAAAIWGPPIPLTWGE